MMKIQMDNKKYNVQQGPHSTLLRNFIINGNQKGIKLYLNGDTSFLKHFFPSFCKLHDTKSTSTDIIVSLLKTVSVL